MFSTSKGFIKLSKLLIALVTITLAITIITPAQAVDIEGIVTNEAPDVGEIQICETSCAYYKALNPATALTIKVTATDPNGAADINWLGIQVQIYKSADTNNDTIDWDHIDLNLGTGGGLTQTASNNGCNTGGDVNCFDVATSAWTVKFLDGGADVWVRIEDNNTAYDINEMEYSASDLGILVGGTTGITQDTTAGTFTGTQGTDDINFASADTSNSYIVTTHNANLDLNITVTATDLTSGSYTIGDDNISYHTANMETDGNTMSGGADLVTAYWGRGTDPTSATQNTYYWLDIPSGQMRGAYTGTYTYGSSAS